MAKQKIKIGMDEDLKFQAKNNSGAILDLTTAEITFTMKAVNGTQAVQKKNTAAGGGDDQIEIINAELGQYVVLIPRNDTVYLNQDYYSFSCLVTISGTDYISTGLIYLESKNLDVTGVTLNFAEITNGDATNKYLVWDSGLWLPSDYETLIGYKVYTALITQSGTNDPTAIIVGTNTIGNIIWTRIGQGLYYGTLSNAFSLNKTIGFQGGANPVLGKALVVRNNNDTFAIVTADNIGNAIDGILTNFSIEIRVYPE